MGSRKPRLNPIFQAPIYACGVLATQRSYQYFVLHMEPLILEIFENLISKF
jgi:hypothetical protein